MELDTGALKKFSNSYGGCMGLEFDFRLDELPIVVSSKNAEVKYGTKDDLEGNQMIVFPNDRFEVKVIGFDMKSNLLIEARKQ